MVDEDFETAYLFEERILKEKILAEEYAELYQREYRAPFIEESKQERTRRLDEEYERYLRPLYSFQG